MYNEGETERERPIQAASPIVSPGRGRGRPRGGGGFAGNDFSIFLFLKNFLEKKFYFQVSEVVEVVQRVQLRLP